MIIKIRQILIVQKLFSKMFVKNIAFCCLMILCKSMISFFHEEIINQTIKLFDGGRESLYYLDDANDVHPIFIEGSTLSFGMPQEIQMDVKHFKISTANIKSSNFIGMASNTSICLLEETTSREILLYKKEQLGYIFAINMGRTPYFFYIITYDNIEQVYDLWYHRLSGNKVKWLFSFPSDSKPTQIFTYLSRVVCGLENGTVFLVNSSAHQIQYEHAAAVTFLDVNIEDEMIVTGDANGEIILSGGDMKSGFQPILSYCEHECAIVSVMFYEGFLISSDACGIIVQFDFTRNSTLDRIRLPKETEYSVFLSQLLYEGFGAAAQLGSSIIFLYNLDNQTREETAIDLEANITSQMGESGESQSEQDSQSGKTKQEQAKEDPSVVDPIVKFSQTVVGIPSLRLVLKFTMSWLVWLEDFYYYSYHRYEYNKGIKVFLSDIYFINDDKVSPDLVTVLEKNYLSKYLKFVFESYAGYYPIKQQSEKKQTPMHFLEYTKSIYIEGLIQQLSFFVVLKIVFKILFWCISNPKVKLIISEFEGNTFWWFFFLSFMTDNTLYLSFACAAQFRTPFSFNFADKGNLVSSVMIFFVLVVYCFGFFFLTHALYKKKRIAQAALYQSEPCLRGFVMESILFGTRNLFNGFIHGFFLDDHDTQVILLIIVGFFIVFWTCLNRKIFNYRICFIFTFLYHLGFTTFNILVLIELKGITFIWKFAIELVDYYLLVTMLGLVCLRFIIEIILFIYQRKKYKQRVDKFIKKYKKELKLAKKTQKKGETQVPKKSTTKKQAKQKINQQEKEKKQIEKSFSLSQKLRGRSNRINPNPPKNNSNLNNVLQSKKKVNRANKSEEKINQSRNRRRNVRNSSNNQKIKTNSPEFKTKKSAFRNQHLEIKISISSPHKKQERKSLKTQYLLLSKEKVEQSLRNKKISEKE